MIPAYTLKHDDTPELISGKNGWSVLHIFRGSVAHGMFVPSTDPLSFDDIDTLNIVVPGIEYYLGLREYGSRGTHEIKRGEWDVVSYEIRKFISMLSQGNPNVICSLWTDDKYIISATCGGMFLRSNRDLFSTKHIYDAFSGYASSQLRRMEKFSFEGYMGEKRRSLVNKFGYDTKNASHCIRLLRMAFEFFETGIMNVDRSEIDAQDLLDIKHGKYDISYVKNLAEDLFDNARTARDKSDLPENPDYEKINILCKDIILDEFVRRDVIRWP